ncbi:hypothetical protein Y032_0008g127 [Ancylostoma ceylanicum]|uniref:F-box domain-containing protein n=2 Tax=Ancylostoma ceylanicum TaxID=53326 RepID=A0A016VLQ1_9BILA|nr:hypothetical protein Y032_0008g127 [Ancylostoma ceylanicum]
MGDDVFDILNLPTTAVRRMLRFLRYPDLRNVARAIPSFCSLCDDEYRKVDREFQSRRDFKWTRFASSNDEESMAPRGLHSMAYHEKECAMYAFGGEAPDWRLQGDACGPASFNDLWRLDMTSLKWSRVVVKSSPYPLPKYLCSMVVYKDELLIYGGCRPLPRHGSAMHLNEMHIFNTKKRAYRILVTTNDGPSLAGHASCMHGDLFIVHGGVVSTCEVSYRVSVLDMVTKRWFNAPLPGFPTVLHYLATSHIPSFMVGSSSLVVLREGCLLATGENMRDDLPENTSILFIFDPKDPEGVDWQYKLIPGIGRWWPPVGLSPPPSNRNFGGIAVMRCDRLIRLISLGMPQKGSKDSRCNITYDSVQKRSTNFIKHVRCILEAEMSRREQVRRYCRENDEGEAERSAKLSEIIENDGIKCTLGHCYLSTLEAQNCKEARFATKPRTMDLVTVAVTLNPQAESQRSTPLDEVDVAELKLRLRTMIAQLHMKYYSTRPDVLLSPNLPSRNSSFRRMVAFTADIPLGDDFDPMRDLNRIEWIPQSVQYGGPPETRKYCLVAARGEVVVHGGSVHFGDGMGMMGYTYLMSPVATQPTMATPITNGNSCSRFDFNVLVIQ